MAPQWLLESGLFYESGLNYDSGLGGEGMRENRKAVGQRQERTKLRERKIELRFLEG